jgi:uncharacterized membrane protein
VILFAVRVLLPSAIVAAGVVLLLVGGENEAGAGVALIGCAVVVVLFNLFLRLGVRDAADRDRDEAAREHFDRHGRWPDEE